MLIISCHEPYSSLSFWFKKKLKLTWKRKLAIFPLFNFCLMIPELWNIHGSNEMTSLKTSSSGSTFDVKFNYTPYIKSRLRKDSLLILPCSELLWFNWEPGWVKCQIFALSKNKTLEHSKGKLISCWLWQQLPHLACMILSIGSIITLIMLYYSSPIQNEN